MDEGAPATNGLVSVGDGPALDDLVLDDRAGMAVGTIVASWRLRDTLPKGIGPAGRVLVVGPPGSGRTTVAKALASALGRRTATVRPEAFVSSYPGEAAGKLRSAVVGAAGEGMAVLLDDLDALMPPQLSVPLAHALDELDGDSFVVATVSEGSVLEAPLARRFQETVRLGSPGREERRRMAGIFVGVHDMESGMDLEVLADSTAAMSLAEIEGVLESLARYAAVNRPGEPMDAGFVRRFLRDTGREPDIRAMRESGMTIAEIERATGIPRSTVSYRLRRDLRDRGRGALRGAPREVPPQRPQVQPGQGADRPELPERDSVLPGRGDACVGPHHGLRVRGCDGIRSRSHR